jgi:hypothetical protein
MNTNRNNLKILIFVFCLIAFQAAEAFSQNTPPPTPPAPKIERKPIPRVRVFPPRAPLPREDAADSEKLIAVDGKVNISLCVLEGNLKINGSDRNEVRVFVKSGSRIGFNVLQKNRQSLNPVWIKVLGFDPAKNQLNRANECLWGDEIEIDVPRNSSVNVKGQEIRASVDSVRKAVVKNVGGDITLRNIAEGVEAATYEGDVTVENSGGALKLESATGNIVAFEVSPSEIGDIFKAKTTNGTIALQGLEHRQIEVNSISGSILFNGNFLSGGVYNFGTSNGVINLAIPADSSCKITASYGFGGLTSEIPINKIIENKNPRGQNIIGTMGNGDATLNLTTASGAIRIKSKNKK